MAVLSNSFLERWSRIRNALDAVGAGMLVVSDDRNFAYLTGYLSREFAKRFRHLLAVMDTDGNVHVLVPQSEVDGLRIASPDLRVHAYDTEPLTAARAVAFLCEFQPREATPVCIERSGEDRPCLTADFIDQLRRQLPSAAFVDASPILARARLLKDADELAALRSAAEIAQQSWLDTLPQLRAGVRLRDVARILSAQFAAHGAAYNFPGHIDLRNATDQSSDVIESGQILWCDFGVTVQGYHSDIARRAVIGSPTPQQSMNHTRGADLLHRLVAGLWPGRQIRDAVEEMIAARHAFHAGGTLTGRFGHGLGLSPAEPPSLSLDETATLEVGMVLTPEPSFVAADGEFVHLEEMVVVHADGPLLLSHGAETLGRIGE